MSEKAMTQAEARTWGHGVVGRKASMLRSDGKWWTVRIVSYEPDEKMHLLDIEPGKPVWYDICHPLRRIRWYNEQGILLPEGVEPEDFRTEKKRAQMYRKKTFPYIEIIISDFPDTPNPIAAHVQAPIDCDKIFIDSKDNAYVLDKSGTTRIPVYLPWSQAKRKRQAPLRPPDGNWEKLQKLCRSAGDNPLIYCRVRFFSPSEQSWIEGRVMYTRINALGDTQYWIHFDNGSTRWYDINVRDCRILEEYGSNQVGKYIAVQWVVPVTNTTTNGTPPQNIPSTQRVSLAGRDFNGQRMERRWYVAKVIKYAPMLNMHHIRYLSELTLDENEMLTTGDTNMHERGVHESTSGRPQYIWEGSQLKKGQLSERGSTFSSAQETTLHTGKPMMSAHCPYSEREYFSFQSPMASVDELACLHSRPHLWMNLASDLPVSTRFLGKRLHFYDPDSFSIDAGVVTNFVLPPCIYRSHHTIAATTATGEPSAAEPVQNSDVSTFAIVDNVHEEGQAMKRVLGSKVIRNGIVCGLGLLPLLSEYNDEFGGKNGERDQMYTSDPTVGENEEERRGVPMYQTSTAMGPQRVLPSVGRDSLNTYQPKGESTESIHIASGLGQKEEVSSPSAVLKQRIGGESIEGGYSYLQGKPHEEDTQRAAAIRSVILHPSESPGGLMRYSTLENSSMSARVCSLQCAKVTIVLEQGGMRRDIPLSRLFMRWIADKVTADGFPNVDSNDPLSMRFKDNDVLTVAIKETTTWGDAEKLAFWRNRVGKFPFPSYPLIPAGVGLINTGNLCWLSSVLQCLARVDPLVEYLGAGPNKDLFRRLYVSNEVGYGGRLAVSLSEIFFLLRRQEALSYLQLQCNKARIVCEVDSGDGKRKESTEEELKDNPFWDEIKRDPILTFTHQIITPNTAIHSSLVPCFVKSLLSEHVATFDGLLQQDAHELIDWSHSIMALSFQGLIILLDGLHEDLKIHSQGERKLQGLWQKGRLESRASMDNHPLLHPAIPRGASYRSSSRLLHDPDDAHFSRMAGEGSSEVAAIGTNGRIGTQRNVLSEISPSGKGQLHSEDTKGAQLPTVSDGNVHNATVPTNQYSQTRGTESLIAPRSSEDHGKQDGRYTRKGIWTFFSKMKRRESTPGGIQTVEGASSAASGGTGMFFSEGERTANSQQEKYAQPAEWESNWTTDMSHPRETRKSVRSMDLRSLHVTRSSGLSREILPFNMKSEHSFIKQLFFVRTAYEFMCGRNAKHRTIHFGPSEGEFLPPTPIIDSRKIRSGWLGAKRTNASASLKDFIDLAFAAETVEKTCEQCGKKSSMQLQPWLLSLPPVIILQLKRFQFDPMTNTHSKVSFPVRFPLDGLSLDKYLLSEDSVSLTAKDKQLLRDIRYRSFMFNSSIQQKLGKEKKSFGKDKRTKGGADEQASTYSLFGVICHSGTLERGHYTAFSRPSGSLRGEHAFPFTRQVGIPPGGQQPKHFGTWQYFDDSYVFPVTDEEMQSEKIQEQVYLLFYMRNSA